MTTKYTMELTPCFNIKCLSESGLKLDNLLERLPDRRYLFGNSHCKRHPRGDICIHWPERTPHLVGSVQQDRSSL